ncbi:FtsX-like permease family protein [Conexibacter woesei]|uniref:ABC3 transporter permease C-terminal domain-containing protein n=1 Tax=Conexibacter woesei (strain DSM 14684 / CCUG 47730 / CIP 108061 / JCM 11494 / NBRC 100937 / ID131577) TaxID=469383 RepID=D3F451_CONWI|nr:FtsX-like permease family protein [Conexibacter woesei]ADB50423.1 protein of unknown function DUF214 [Conexibacter woesei DSM 14684]
MRFLADLPWLYWLRLRAQPVQELLALTGIATGVAILFAVQVANSSVTGSVRQLVAGLAGSSELALVARDPRGVQQRTAERVAAIAGVRASAPLLLARATASGPDGEASVQLAGATPAFAALGGPLPRMLAAGGASGAAGANGAAGAAGASGAAGANGAASASGAGGAPDALVVPAPLARTLGVSDGATIRIATYGRAFDVPIRVAPGRDRIGVLADSRLLAGPLALVQRLTGLQGRVSRVLVAPAGGRDPAVADALRTLAAGRASVVPSDEDVRLLDQAAAPGEQSTSTIAVIAMLVGLLFAFHAMLLTIPERRRFGAELRRQGFGRTQLTALALFEALALGLVASLVGLLLGDQLLRHVFGTTPGYLGFAFPVGGARVVRAEDVALALGGGLLATLLAAARLIADADARRPLDGAGCDACGDAGDLLPARMRRLLPAAAVALAVTAGALYAFAPEMATVAVGALGLAVVLVLPAVLDLALRLADRFADSRRGGLLSIAVSELRASAPRVVALSATGALAVFGAVAIEGARRDLVRGLDDNQASYVGTADVWVTAGGDENALTVAPFRPPRQLAALRHDPAIAAVRPYRAGFADFAGRRAWIVARAAGGPPSIPPRQLVAGDRAAAERALRAGGAAVVSVGLARRVGVGVGDVLRLPTPSGTAALRVAATITNLGWSPGAILLGGADHRRLWPGGAVTAAEIDLAPGVEPADGRQLVAAALGPGAALTVETAAERLDRLQRLSRQGLERLSQIATLMLVAAVLAMTGAVWQQRRRLAVLRMQGFDVEQVWGVLLLQSALVLGVGAALGAVAGLAGQALATRWVVLTTGFPSSFSPAVGLAAWTFAAIALVAPLVVSIPGWFAARVSPVVSFQRD